MYSGKSGKDTTLTTLTVTQNFLVESAQWDDVAGVRHLRAAKPVVCCQPTTNIHSINFPMMPTFNSTTSCNLPLITIASVAIAVILNSWRRQAELERECERLKSQLSSKLQKENAKRRPQNMSTGQASSSDSSLDRDGLYVKPIGVIHSIYRLCVGTPRQGLLAPMARGTIELHKLGDSSLASSVEGLEGYSHIWILFVFHLNTQSSRKQRVKSKIAPPALGGEKVGIYATRTPHRYNPVGLTLCRLDRIQVDNQRVILHISGLDLVDGTPVLDIKPYVPVYDSVDMGEELPEATTTGIRVPNWVRGGLASHRTVQVTQEAQSQLRSILIDDPSALQFYGPHCSEPTLEQTLESVLAAIQQVLAIDVRSSYQTRKTRLGHSQAERSIRLKDAAPLEEAAADTCTQQLDRLLVHFTVERGASTMKEASENSGAEDHILVSAFHLLQNQPKR
eukprot:Nitzschia sp. Nitz4//scaffold297_size22919//183//1635//NITZ4_008518-RA/size22919-snap-gene-0.4-mRNA-1//-1//CDS//3329546289//8027//frame0